MVLWSKSEDIVLFIELGVPWGTFAGLAYETKLKKNLIKKKTELKFS